MWYKGYTGLVAKHQFPKQSVLKSKITVTCLYNLSVQQKKAALIGSFAILVVKIKIQG